MQCLIIISDSYCSEVSSEMRLSCTSTVNRKVFGSQFAEFIRPRRLYALFSRGFNCDDHGSYSSYLIIRRIQWTSVLFLVHLTYIYLYHLIFRSSFFIRQITISNFHLAHCVQSVLSYILTGYSIRKQEKLISSNNRAIQLKIYSIFDTYRYMSFLSLIKLP